MWYHGICEFRWAILIPKSPPWSCIMFLHLWKIRSFEGWIQFSTCITSNEILYFIEIVQRLSSFLMPHAVLILFLESVHLQRNSFGCLFSGNMISVKINQCFCLPSKYNFLALEVKVRLKLNTEWIFMNTTPSFHLFFWLIPLHSQLYRWIWIHLKKYVPWM